MALTVVTRGWGGRHSDDGAGDGGYRNDCYGRLSCCCGCSGRCGRWRDGGSCGDCCGVTDCWCGGCCGRSSKTTGTWNSYCTKGNRSTVSHTFPFFKCRQDENRGDSNNFRYFDLKWDLWGTFFPWNKRNIGVWKGRRIKDITILSSDGYDDSSRTRNINGTREQCRCRRQLAQRSKSFHRTWHHELNCRNRSRQHRVRNRSHRNRARSRGSRKHRDGLIWGKRRDGTKGTWEDVYGSWLGNDVGRVVGVDALEDESVSTVSNGQTGRGTLQGGWWRRRFAGWERGLMSAFGWDGRNRLRGWW